MIGCTLVFSSIPKIRAPWAWYRILLAYELFPDGITRTIVVVVPWVEAAVAIALLFGILRRAGLAIAFLLFAGFALAQTSVVFRGLVVECGCFSVSGGSQVDAWTIARVLCLMLATGAALRMLNARAARNPPPKEFA